MTMKILWLLTALVLIPLSGFAGEKKVLHRQAALEMMQASGVPQMLERAFAAQLESQFKALPELEKIRPQLTAFYRKTFAFKELENDLCALYMKHYTCEELQQITAFFKTPAGRKKAKVDGTLSTELSALFLRRSGEKMAELQKLLQQLTKE